MTTPNDPLEFKNSIPIHDQKFLEKQNKNQFLPGQKNYNSLGSEENIHLKKLAQTLRNHSSSKRTKKLHFLSNQHKNQTHTVVFVPVFHSELRTDEFDSKRLGTRNLVDAKLSGDQKLCSDDCCCRLTSKSRTYPVTTAATTEVVRSFTSIKGFSHRYD